jgi:hypothetical protein
MGGEQRLRLGLQGMAAILNCILSTRCFGTATFIFVALPRWLDGAVAVGATSLRPCLYASTTR